MRNPERIPKVLDVLKQVWTNWPDLRLGQIIDNARMFSRSKTELFFIEDDQLLLGLFKLMEEKKKVKAPFTNDQVESLKGFQNAGCFHPFTCECGADLEPTNAGWICPAKCGYTQDWCHDFMANWEWKKLFDIMQAGRFLEKK